MSAAIDARAVSVTYDSSRGPLDVLRDVTLHIEPGEFVCFLGRSGCGKTTLLNAIAGLVPYRSGELLVDGRRISDPSNRNRLAYVFQDHRLLPWRTAMANAAFVLEAHGVARGERDRRARAALDLVGLRDFGHAYPRQLSGGMRSRVALARAIAIQPAVLLMDEPFGALDAQTRRTLQDELLHLWRTQGHTVVFVTHDILEAIYLADRIVVLAPGTIGVKHIETIALDRPRSITDEAVLRIYTRLSEMIET